MSQFFVVISVAVHFDGPRDILTEQEKKNSRPFLKNNMLDYRGRRSLSRGKTSKKMKTGRSFLKKMSPSLKTKSKRSSKGAYRGGTFGSEVPVAIDQAKAAIRIAEEQVDKALKSLGKVNEEEARQDLEAVQILQQAREELENVRILQQVRKELEVALILLNHRQQQ